jgi:uncharacterized protein YndB with AHSA1/START domain
MIDDPISHAGLVAREVRSSSRDGAPTRVAVARRTYATDLDDLWNALTDPERLPRWFLPVSGDLRPGGRYQLEGNAGGVIERCEEPSLLALTWEMGPMVSWVTVSLTSIDGSTQLELVHEAPVDPDFWEQFGPGAVGVGWDLALMGLGLHLTTAAPVDPEAGLAFPLTETGTAFVRAAAHGWRDAAIADGDDAEAAAAAAERSVTFYTVLPDEDGTS